MQADSKIGENPELLEFIEFMRRNVLSTSGGHDSLVARRPPRKLTFHPSHPNSMTVSSLLTLLPSFQRLGKRLEGRSDRSCMICVS